MHFVGRIGDAAPAPHPVWVGHSEGYTEAWLIDHRTGSVHTGLSLNHLAAGGAILPHVHSFEEGFYILEGEATVNIGDRAWALGPGDFGALKVGTLHAFRNVGAKPVRWLQMAAPQPKPHGKERDTFFLKGGFSGPGVAAEAVPLDLSRLDGALLGHFDPGQIPPPNERSADFAPGVFLKWLVDEKFGARHHRMVYIEYQPGAKIALHDHTFEEAYFVLSGEIEAILDGERYLAKAGDVIWTGVGCVHAFANVGSEPVRWLETFSPQPPSENVFRFTAEWEQRARELEG